MSIYSRGNVWWYNITVKGRTFRGSCKTTDKQAAQEFHDLLKADIWRGRVIGVAAQKTVDEAIDRFLQEHVHKRSYRDDQRHGQWWKEQFKSAQVVMLEEVTADVVKDIRDDAMEQLTRRGVKVAPATVNRKLAFMSAVVRVAALEWQWLPQAPKLRMMAGEVQRHRFLTPNEVIRLVEALPRPYADMALLAVSTGLRQSNITRLMWKNIDMTRKVATFPKQVMKNGRPFSCSLNETACAIIQKWMGQHDEFVFVRLDGEPINGIPSTTWKAALAKVGLENVRWHDLRHTWASLLRQSGVNLSDLQELGGWESSIMVQRYAHMNIEHLAPKAAVMDGILTAGKSGVLRVVSG